MPQPTPTPTPARRAAVLLACADHARQQAVRAAVLQVAPEATITAVASTLAAIRHSLGEPLHLVIIDWANDDAGAPALLRHLQRLHSGVCAFAFDDLAADTSPAVMPWRDLPRVLQRWAARQRPDRTDLD